MCLYNTWVEWQSVDYVRTLEAARYSSRRPRRLNFLLHWSSLARLLTARRYALLGDVSFHRLCTVVCRVVCVRLAIYNELWRVGSNTSPSAAYNTSSYKLYRKCVSRLRSRRGEKIKTKVMIDIFIWIKLMFVTKIKDGVGWLTGPGFEAITTMCFQTRDGLCVHNITYLVYQNRTVWHTIALD